VKTTAAYFFLLFYTLAICKPILPVVKDNLAHIFWKSKHIATVHLYHGEHHAGEELAEAALEESGEKKPVTSKISEPVSVHTLVDTHYFISRSTIPRERFAVTIYTVSTVSLDKYYPPPKSC
jgi:hypothetical protein